MKDTLLWAPRILAILFIGFISLFAFDSFTGDDSFGTQIGHFFLHLIPSFALVICLLVAWRLRIIGGLLFLITALIFTIYFGTYHRVSDFLLISATPLLVGILFVISQWTESEND